MEKVLYEKDGRIARVTLNRPEARNAIDPEVHKRLWEIWQDFRDDDTLDLAILTGAGSAFCAGADLKTFIPPLLSQGIGLPRNKIEDGLGGLTRGLHRIKKPVIAAVNGWALAGGLELAMACDIRIASERAMFGSFEVRRGYHHGDGGIVRLVNTCGTGIALEMLLTGEPIDSERAFRANMVSRVTPHDKLMETTEMVAMQVLRNDQFAIRSAKETIQEMVGRTLDDQLRLEAIYGYSCAANPNIPKLLGKFYDKTDAGRAGEHTTEL